MTSEQSLDETPLAVAAASRYAAFISYRHVDPDRWWAKWLHRKLETYPVPRQLVATGSAKRIGRMFRDEEEFAASSDLSLEIDTALEQSRFLIIVCSPRTPDSEWVNQEIVRFAELGRQDRILTLLIEGEPEASFPPALREIRRAAMPQMSGEDEPPDAVEPLAADVRDLVGESSRTVKRLAFLRLAATLLERRFDELRQRDQERRTRQLLQISAALGVLLLGVGLLALFAFQQKLAAEHQRAVAEARMLVSQGEAEFEQEPLAGLRIAAEGLARVPADEAQLSQSLLRRVAVKAAEGRVMKISGDVSDVYHRLPEFPYVLLRNRYTPGVLIHAPDLRVVERIDRLAPQNPLRVTPSLQHYVIAQDGGDGPPYRLISTGNGKLIGRTNSLSGLTLLPNRDPLYFVQDVGISPRVYRLDKGTELGKAGFDIRKISYTPGSAVFAIYYRDDEHTRIPPPPDLFDLKTGQVVETLYRDTGEIWFDGAGTPFYVRALGGAGWQLRRFDVPGDVVGASAEEPYWVSFSRAPTGYWLMGLSKRTQIRRSSDGALIDSLDQAFSEATPLADGISWIVRKAGSSAAQVLALVDDKLVLHQPAEIPVTREQSFIPIPPLADLDGTQRDRPIRHEATTVAGLYAATPEDRNQRRSVWRYLNKDRPVYFEDEYPSDLEFFYIKRFYDDEDRDRDDLIRAELRRTKDHSLVLGSHDDIRRYGVDPSQGLVWLQLGDPDDSEDRSVVVIRFSDSKVIWKGGAKWVSFPPDPSAGYFFVWTGTNRDRIRRTEDGAELVSLGGTLRRLDFETLAADGFFIAAFVDGRHELWESEGEPVRVHNLGFGLRGYLVIPGGLLLIWYENGNAYVIDPSWLADLGNDPASLPASVLLEKLCKGMFTEARLSADDWSERIPKQARACMH